MNELKAIRKSVRKKAIAGGILIRVAAAVGVTRATVSRTINGKFDNPNPAVVMAILDDMRAHNLLPGEESARSFISRVRAAHKSE